MLRAAIYRCLPCVPGWYQGARPCVPRCRRREGSHLPRHVVDDIVAATNAGMLAMEKTDPTRRFGVYGKGELAKVIKVYDGDTLTLAFAKYSAEGARVTRASVRLLGFDAPELKYDRPVEHECAIFCRDNVAHLVMGEVVLVDFHGMDTLGRRPLAVIRPCPSRHEMSSRFGQVGVRFGSINEWCVNTLPGCVRYDGKKKNFIPFKERNMRGWEPSPEAKRRSTELCEFD